MSSKNTTFLLLFTWFLALAVYADTHWYAVWTRYPDNSLIVVDGPDGAPKSNAELETMLKQDGSMVTSSVTRNMGKDGYTWWFMVSIEDDLISDKYEHFELVKYVNDLREQPKLDPSQSSAYRGEKRATTVEKQADAPRGLKFISMPNSGGNELNNADVTYNYEESAGRSSRVYVIDSGLNLDATTAWDGRRVEWIHAQPFGSTEQKDVSDGHGSCMADLAIGKINGVAKNAEVTAVQMNVFANDFISSLWYESASDALSQTLDDIFVRDIGKQAVVLMSWGIEEEETDVVDWETFSDAYYLMLQKLIELGTTIVIATSNHFRCAEEELPCAFGNPEYHQYLEQVIVVGAGKVNDGSFFEPEENRDPWVEFYAPGADEDPGVEGISCAAGSGSTDQKDVKGASPAAAYVAGLAAYIKDVYPDAVVKERIFSWLYKRNGKDENAPMIWNGQTQ